VEEDGSLAGVFRLPPLAGAIAEAFLAGKAAAADNPDVYQVIVHVGAGVSAETFGAIA
jgi:hypothetical protein